jgi:hypothetical protein
MAEAEQADDTADRIHHLERQADKQRDLLRRAATKFALDEIDRQGYELLRDGAQSELAEIAQELARLGAVSQKEALPDFDTVLAEVGGWHQAIHSSDLAERRSVLSELVDRVVPVRVTHASYDARITWTQAGALLRALIEGAAFEDAA